LPKDLAAAPQTRSFAEARFGAVMRNRTRLRLERNCEDLPAGRAPIFVMGRMRKPA
jgi:hypothetical protein